MVPLFVRKPRKKDLPASSADVAQPFDLARPAWRLVLVLAWPVLLQQLLIFSVLLSDRFLAGHFQPLAPEEQAEAAGHRLLALGVLGSGPAQGIGAALAAEAPWELARRIAAKHVAYQAAQTTALYMSWFINSYIILVSVGSTALVARFVGAGDRALAIHITNQSLLLAVILGVLGTVAGLAGVSPLMNLLQLRGDAAALAAAYLRPLFALLIFQIIESAGIACLVGAGDTRTGFWVLGGVAVLNVPLAWLLFHGAGLIPRFGFVGIALGTAISHTIGGMVVLAVLGLGRAGLRIEWRYLWPHGDLLYRLLRVSVPAGVDSLSAVLGHLAFLGLVNRLGDTASSAHGIALGWEALGYLSGNAFGTAAMTLVGQNLGARRPGDATRCGWMAFGLGGAVMSIMAIIFFTWATPMFALFCPDPSQKPIIDAGVPVLRLVAFAMPATASAIIFTYALRGAGDTRVPVLFTWLGFLGVRLPLAYWLTRPEFGLGLYGAWLAMVADLFVRGTLMLTRFAGGRWQGIRV
jgi:putative MATE family efflux protein